MNHPRSLSRFGDDLADAVTRPRSEPSRVRSVVAACAALITAVVLVLAPSQIAGADDVTVSFDGDTVVMEVRTTATAAQISAKVAEHNLNVSVLGTPTGPSRIGSLARTGGPLRSDPSNVSVLRFDRGSRAEFYFGEPAEPAEPYVLITDGFDELEPFHDLAWMEGLDFDDVDDELFAAAQRRGIELSVERHEEPVGGDSGTISMLRMFSDRTATVFVAG